MTAEYVLIGAGAISPATAMTARSLAAALRIRDTDLPRWIRWARSVSSPIVYDPATEGYWYNWEEVST